MENVDYKLFNDTSFYDCHICFVGREKCTPGYSYGPSVRPSYIIHYVISGKGRFFCNNNTYDLKENNAFLIEPDIMTFYQADFEEPWHYMWIGIKGNKFSEFLERMGKNYMNPIFYCDKKEELCKIMDKILATDSSGIKQEFKRQSLLYSFLSYLTPDSMYTNSMVNSDEIRENSYLVKAIEFIQNNYYHLIRVTDVADYLGISRNYLFTIFKNALGHSPQEYINYFKLNRACNLLDDSGYTIENIAYSCGYDELSSFSRAFRKKYGVTPSKYRKLKSQRSELTQLELIRYMKKMNKGK